MPEVAFVWAERHDRPLREFAATVRYELGLQAVPSSLHLGRFPDVRPDRVYLLLDPHGYVEAEGEAALPDDAVLKRTIFVCIERLTASLVERADLLKRAGAVFAIDQRSVVALHRVGIPARLMRPGYSKSLDHFDPQARRPIDVMFLGGHSARRARYLSLVGRVLARRNCRLHLTEADASPDDVGSFIAEERWPLLAETKVVINLHCGDESRLEWRRVVDAIHAGAVVVTEHSSGIAPLVPGEHLLAASADSLPYVVEALLGDDEQLASLRVRAYERLRTWLPYALAVSVLRASVVELVGEPLPLGASRGAPGPSNL